MEECLPKWNVVGSFSVDDSMILRICFLRIRINTFMIGLHYSEILNLSVNGGRADFDAKFCESIMLDEFEIV